MRYLIIASVLCACGSFPEEVIVANAVQKQAAEAIESDYQKLAEASTAEIERMGLLILDAEVERRWVAASSNGSVPLEAAREIASWANVERAKVRQARDDKRKQLMESPNLALMVEMNQALRDYLISTQSAAREIERLIGAKNESK
jgi:hypothetical protein